MTINSFHSINAKTVPNGFQDIVWKCNFSPTSLPALSLTFEGSQTRQSPGNLITAMIPLISSRHYNETKTSVLINTVGQFGLPSVHSEQQQQHFEKEIIGKSLKA